MQDIENDMDNLFRKAANNYKPDAGNSGWSIIEPLLDRDANVPAVIKTRPKKSKMALGLLLLPAIAGVLNFYFINHAIKKVAANSSLNSKHHKKSKAFISDKKIVQIKASNASYNKTINTAGNKNSRQQELTGGLFHEHLLRQAIRQACLSNFNESPATVSSIINGSLSYSPTQSFSQNKLFLQDTNTSIYPLPAALKITASAKQKRFYLGIVLGGAFNQVQGQGFKKAGFNAGVIAGYKLSKNVSVETGLIYARKNYFSDGKYFNMAKMPANMKIFSLKGCIDAVEIPINVKYNAVQTNTSTAFISAGISSYIITQENNDYLASVNGARQSLKGIYKKVSAGLASSINLSVGYEHALGKQNAVRIQPYLQIPLNDVGIGNMMLTGTGINIALIKTFK